MGGKQSEIISLILLMWTCACYIAPVQPLKCIGCAFQDKGGQVFPPSKQCSCRSSPKKSCSDPVPGTRAGEEESENETALVDVVQSIQHAFESKSSPTPKAKYQVCIMSRGYMTKGTYKGELGLRTLTSLELSENPYSSNKKLHCEENIVKDDLQIHWVCGCVKDFCNDYSLTSKTLPPELKKNSTEGGTGGSSTQPPYNYNNSNILAVYGIAFVLSTTASLLFCFHCVDAGLFATKL